MVQLPTALAGDLPHRPGAVRLITPTAGAPPGPARLHGVSPEALFALGAIAQYSGASIAVRLFDHATPATVAYLRILGGAGFVLAVTGASAFRGWTSRSLALVSTFGITTALMNLFIYLAIARIDLGKAVAVEFAGPIAVAALTTRTTRNVVAVVLAAIGIVALSQVDFDAAGLGWVLAASIMWAGYIVAGWRVARLQRGFEGLGVGLLLGSFVVAPFAAPNLGATMGRPGVVSLCLLVGVLSTGVAYGLDQLILRRTSARRFALLQALLPVTAAVMGAIVLSQYPHGLDYAGIALILVAVVTQSRDS